MFETFQTLDVDAVLCLIASLSPERTQFSISKQRLAWLRKIHRARTFIEKVFRFADTSDSESLSYGNKSKEVIRKARLLYIYVSVDNLNALNISNNLSLRTSLLRKIILYNNYTITFCNYCFYYFG